MNGVRMKAGIAKRRFIGLLVLSLAGNPALAGSGGFDILNTAVGGRPSAMAGAFIAVPGDVYNLVYNPAGLARISSPIGTLTYVDHLLDFQSGFIGYVHPTPSGVLGIGVQYLDFGQFDRLDNAGNNLGNFGANNLAVSISFARTYGSRVMYGVNGKLLRAEIDTYGSTAFALDAAVMIEMPQPDLYIGFGIFNLGTVQSAFINTKEPLPLTFRVGFSKKLEHLPLLASFVLMKERDQTVRFAAGGDFQLSDNLFLRLGYNSIGSNQRVGTDRDRFAGVSLGLGLKVSRYSVDYSFSSFGEVGALNRVSLSGSF
jgi:hypothetical protein